MTVKDRQGLELTGASEAEIGSGFKACTATARIYEHPADVPVIIFSGVPSESAELERVRPRTRLIEKPYSLVLLVEALDEMLAAGSQNLHS